MGVRAVILAAGCACVTAASGCAPTPDAPARARAVSAAAPTAPAPAPSVTAASVQIAMRNVRLHVAEGIVLQIRRLDGVMAGRAAGQPPVFDDQRSYMLRVQAAEMSIDMSSLATLMNRHVFGYQKAPLTGLSASGDREGRLHFKGKLHKGLTVPFSTTMTANVTDDGRMRLHVESMKAAGVPVKGVLHVLGLQLDDLVTLKSRHDVTIEGDDVLMAPGEALPPPAIHGRLSRVMVTGQHLALTFLSTSASRESRRPRSGASPPNLISFTGGTIRFGKLTMTDADLRLIDADPRDPFDFFPAEYQRQLVAGYSRNTPSGGLRTYMPDYDDLVRRRPQAELDPRHAQAPRPPGR